MTVVLDASLVAAWHLPQDRFHRTAEAYLRKIAMQGEQTIAPAVLLSEVVGTVRRNASLDDALEALDLLMNAGIVLIETTAGRARDAAVLGAQASLRGCDALYVGVAVEFRAALATFDIEQANRARELVTIADVGV